MCPECWADLSRKAPSKPKVPTNSLVRVDTGKVPLWLEPLTAIEAKLLAPCRASRDMYLMKPSGSRQDRPNDAYQTKWTGHVLAYPQASAREVQLILPADPEQAAASIPVVFLAQASTREEVEEMARNSPALQVGHNYLYHMHTLFISHAQLFTSHAHLDTCNGHKRTRLMGPACNRCCLSHPGARTCNRQVGTPPCNPMARQRLPKCVDLPHQRTPHGVPEQ